MLTASEQVSKSQVPSRGLLWAIDLNTIPRMWLIKNFFSAKYSFLLASLFSFFIIYPLSFETLGRHFVLDIFFTLILASAAYAVSGNRRNLIIALSLATPAFLGGWSVCFTTVDNFVLAGYIFQALFQAFVTWVIFLDVLRATKITSDEVVGAVAVYLLVGLVSASTYASIELYSPGSFTNPDKSQVQFSELVYLSYVALTTIGFGDILPVSAVARSLIVLEAILGQIYLTVLVARLVSLQIVDQIRPSK